MIEPIAQSDIVGLSTPADLDQVGVDAFWMEKALLLAQQAEINNEVPVGALIVYDGKCIAAACNAPIGLNDPTAHAEILVLRAAGLHLNNYRLTGATLYVTLEPCTMCAGAMVHARIARVVFATHDPRTGACGSVLNVLQTESFNHQCQASFGVLAEQSAYLLRSFFRRRRIKKETLDSATIICQDGG